MPGEQDAKQKGQVIRGRRPNSEGWSRVAAFGTTWGLWLKQGSDGWRTYKLVSVEPQEHKANYWLGYNVVSKRWARNRDVALAAQRMPETLEAVRELAEEIG